jgi:hypothetical protein
MTIGRSAQPAGLKRLSDPSVSLAQTVLEARMLHYIWTKLLWLTLNFGDVRVALPIAAILIVWLCARRRWHTAIWCAVAVLGCSAAVLFLKLAVFAGHLRLPSIALQNPSGHSTISAVVYGSLAWVLSRELPLWRGRALLLLTGAGVAAIGASLYLTNAHTLPDVVVGLTLGSSGAVSFACLASNHEAPARGNGGPPFRLIVAVAIAALSLQALQVAPHLTRAYQLLRISSPSAPA